ncbi:cytochrome d ubiquinol oxidase subunit II [Pseudonocardia sp. 73-21]|jgi:cytochrome d ubiquinol oxidase subunit II|uniref:cytochrome d ubiquinol oxidase subunit II n=1 Tax=Pseudonocardia sp. 73-21 TaxID=1895809 RepID=UPI000968987B|nr:cytochrome d ubiquinol oxidase subunit II [Pseudonocardia sp. 73-21]OJY40516.1 MAG: cytochrome d ubiquinol oxidase subunit II [Pseudonocardia sp. 73-21]
MDLPTVWFVAIAVLWTGYFVLEGFDFGVGMLLPALGRHRGTALKAIGPVWDGNEVWLITAIGAMFAAFPAWYGATLSGFYVPVLLVVLALIVRGVALEYRGKAPRSEGGAGVDTAGEQWRARCDLGIVVGSAVPAFVWGLVFANLVRGVELGADGVVTSSPADLLNPYALLGGLVTLTLFALHGAVFVALKTDGPARFLGRALVKRLAPVAVVALAVFLAQTAAGWVTVVVVGLLVAAALLAVRGREGWAFVATAVTIAALTVVIFGSLYPAVLPSLTDPAFDLTVANAASGPYTLTLLSWVGGIFLPVVIAYQSWSYWVFRRRVTA